MDLKQRCSALISELGIAQATEVVDVRPLTGGVASDIAVVDLGKRRICVKFALPKLKVAADWRAPIHRNAAEYAWLSVAAGVCDASAIKLFGHSRTQHGFAMEYVAGPEVYLWKDHLLDQKPANGEAAKVADLFGKIHAASAMDGFDCSAFQNRDDFRALRIEPYLSYTRSVHPALGVSIQPLEDMLYESAQVLVHGDASPKNILFRHRAPVPLDAECATMGDASFDPAFCLNHLVLKAVHLPRSQDHLLGEMTNFWSAYRRHISWEDPAKLEERLCALLPVLMLARVDGKSPVEYLTPSQQNRVREVAVALMATPANDLHALVGTVRQKLNDGRS